MRRTYICDYCGGEFPDDRTPVDSNDDDDLSCPECFVKMLQEDLGPNVILDVNTTEPSAKTGVI